MCIVVSLQIEGIHRWEECPFEEVSYLRDDHRHIFYIKVTKVVNHDDRDVEIIMLKHEITNYFKEKYYKEEKRVHYFGKKSCEMIGKELIEQFNLESCEVLEDNENGAICFKN